MNVLSLFDGISGAQVALDQIGIKPANYWASEVDTFAIKVTQKNYPETIQLGDVTNWQKWKIPWEDIDLLVAGFPCQAWSVAGLQKGLDDERGRLFLTLVEIFEHLKTVNASFKFASSVFGKSNLLCHFQLSPSYKITRQLRVHLIL